SRRVAHRGCAPRRPLVPRAARHRSRIDRRHVMKIRTIVFAAVGVVVLIVAGLAVFLLTLDVNQYKGRIAEAVKDATGRELTIKGDIKLSLGLTPSLVVNDVSFQN